MEALAQRIEELVKAAHGHALVLFTSYRLMGEVHALLRGRLPFPLLEAWRNGQQIIRLFKNLSNAVLFAAGPCWEGTDFPGDMVSLLVIARLPFPVPDPLSEAEKCTIPAFMITSRQWCCRICSASCGRGLAGPSEQKQIPAWWRFWTSVPRKGNDTIRLCWKPCQSAG